MITTPTFQPTALTLGRVGRNGVRAQQRAREVRDSARDMLSSRFFLEELFDLRLFMFSFLVAVGVLARKGWRWRKRRATAWTALASLKRRSGRSGASAQLAAGTPALGPGADIAQLY